jgi:hypothetical protein
MRVGDNSKLAMVGVWRADRLDSPASSQ